MKRYFLPKAKVLDLKKHQIAGHWLSEKMDGVSAFWDGGITRGMPHTQVPWANKDRKGGRIDLCTGLWSSNANVLHAPRAWLDQMPRMPVIGELWAEDRRDGGYQAVSSIVRSRVTVGSWSGINLWVYNPVSYELFFEDGVIDTPHLKIKFSGIWPWLQAMGVKEVFRKGATFNSRLGRLKFGGRIKVPDYEKLPDSNIEALKVLDRRFNALMDIEAEGLMIQNQYGLLVPARTDLTLKMKPASDAEGRVVGAVAGKGKLAGLMGALVLDYKGKKLELSGFTDRERALYPGLNPDPGSVIRVDDVVHFEMDQVISFKYRRLSRDGVPIEARYWRKR